MPGVPLQAEAGCGPLLQFEYHVRLRVDKAWRVPVLYGRLPAKPDDLSANEDNGAYALSIMLLFRTLRGLDYVSLRRIRRCAWCTRVVQDTGVGDPLRGVRAMAPGRGG